MILRGVRNALNIMVVLLFPDLSLCPASSTSYNRRSEPGNLGDRTFIANDETDRRTSVVEFNL